MIDIFTTVHLSMLSPRGGGGGGGGAYMGDLIDLCLPTLGNLILIFVPRVGIFEFSDQEWIFETGSCDRKEEHVLKPGTNDFASILKEISFSKEILTNWKQLGNLLSLCRVIAGARDILQKFENLKKQHEWNFNLWFCIFKMAIKEIKL